MKKPFVALLMATLFGLTACKTSAPASRALDAGGVGGQAALPTVAQRMGLVLADDGGGVRISAVSKASPACVMLLVAGDRIVRLNQTPLESAAVFEAVARANLEGDFAPWCFEVKRGAATLLLPSNCEFERLLERPETQKYVCDPLNMLLCGPLVPACRRDR